VDDAIAEAAKLAKLEEGYGVVWVERSLSWRDVIAMRLRTAAAWMVKSIAPRRAQLPGLGSAVAEVRGLLELAAKGRPVYLCNCRVD